MRRQTGGVRAAALVLLMPLLVAASDHLNYWSEGYTAMMITDTAFERNVHYHQVSDTAEKLDYRRMAKVVQGVFAATR